MIFRADIILSLTTGTTVAVRSTGITKNIQRTPNIHNANLQDTSYRSLRILLHALTHWSIGMQKVVSIGDAPYPCKQPLLFN